MPAWGGMRRKRIWSMRDCFDHYMRGETYDHIRMDLLFNIYGFSASVWKDTVGGDSKKPAVPDEKRDGSVGKTAGVGKPAQAADFRRAPRRNGSQEIFWE